MPRALSTRTMKKRESMMRGEATFHASFPNLANCVRCATAERSINDISRDTAIKPEQWKADVAAGEWFVCAEPKASCGAGNGACGLRPANSPAAA